MICLFAPSILEDEGSIDAEIEGGCPDHATRELPLVIVENNIDPEANCQVYRTICNSLECSAGDETTPTIRVSLLDGPIQVAYPYDEDELDLYPSEEVVESDVATWINTSFLREVPTLNIDSQVKLENIH
jgi:hypothetical protein